MYSTMIKAICAMTLAVMTPVAVFVDEGIRYGVTETPCEEYGAEYETDDSNDPDLEEMYFEYVGYEESESAAECEVEAFSEDGLCEVSEVEPVSEYELVSECEPVPEYELVSQCEPASEYELVSECEPASDRETTSHCEPASDRETTSHCESASDRETTSQCEPASDRESMSECEPISECEPVLDREPVSACDSDPLIEICPRDDDAAMEPSPAEEETQDITKISDSERITFETGPVIYGEDKVWLKAKVYNPTGAHITRTGFYATTPAGAHAGDETLYVDTTEKEFEIEFTLEGFSDAVLMGPDFEYSFFVVCDGEKYKSSESSFSFPLE